MPELRRPGVTIVLAEQSLDFYLTIADRVADIEKGVVCHAATTEEFAGDLARRAQLLSV